MVLQLRQKHLSRWLRGHLDLGDGVWGDRTPYGAWRRQMEPGLGMGLRTWELGRTSEAIIAVTSLGRPLTQNVGVSM